MSESIRTDIKPLYDRFPNLGNITEAYWKAVVIGNTAVPGPTSYRLQGYVILDSGSIRSFGENFEWQEMPGNWNPGWGNEFLKGYDLTNARWYYSKTFNNFIMSASYVGKLFVERSEGIVYFDIER